ncbi:unnamed protein product [Peronospora farinosa]|uniref:Uncharacterized protein n=1 Tax=Peronospora farinosa TaxID=134698 RepID=A0AAV0SPY9_9STRA|nr:unnamed protein product [Peronospora farinosa]
MCIEDEVIVSCLQSMIHKVLDSSSEAKIYSAGRGNRCRRCHCYDRFWNPEASALTLLRRQLLLDEHNKAYVFVRALTITIMDLLYSTTLYQFDPTEILCKRTWDNCSYTCSGQRKSLASLASIVNSTFFLLMGFSSPAHFIPQDYQWLYFLTPQRFSLAISRCFHVRDCLDEPIYNETITMSSGVESELDCQLLANTSVSTGAITVQQFTEDIYLA